MDEEKPTIKPEHVGKRLLIRSAILTSKAIHETRVLEVSATSGLVKLLLGNQGQWSEVKDWDLLEVLPDQSLLEQHTAALKMAKQQVRALELEKAEVEKGLTALTETLAHTRESVQSIENLNKSLIEECTKMKEKSVQDDKHIFSLNERIKFLEKQTKK